MYFSFIDKSYKLSAINFITLQYLLPINPLLGLVDAIRVGRIREQQLAAIALKERLGATL